MIHALIYHGFPLTYPSGRKERIIYHDIINQIDSRFPKDKNLLINGTWLNCDFQHDLECLLASYHPDKVFICSMGDPWDMDQWASDKFPKSEIYFLGNMDSRYHFNFWSVHFLECSPSYNETDLTLENPSKLFLCYQNKPHLHRQIFTHELIQRNLINIGHVTLQGSDRDFQFDSLSRRSDPDSPTTSHFEDAGLGELNTWKTCYINIVSETTWKIESQTFVSEKNLETNTGDETFFDQW